MAASSITRLALRSARAPLLRARFAPVQRAPAVTFPLQSGSANSAFSTSLRRSSGGHEEETFEEFSARYEKEFDGVQDVFELQRNLNNAFAYDLVPSPGVCIAALKAARRVNDYPTAVRVFEGIKHKVENTHQYEEYLEELKGLREELGINLKEDLYPEGTESPYHSQ